MAKKKRARVAAVDLGAVDQYGRIAQKHESTELKSIPLIVIRPDPGQPRRILPEDLSLQLRRGEINPAEALRQWQTRLRKPGAFPEEKREMAELAQLAHAISLNGLISPITVRRVDPMANPPEGVDYLIITGERRYWAYWMLHLEGRDITEGNSQQSAENIKALVSPEGITIRAHQLLENLFRKDMNAVEKAQALVALRYELSGVTHGLPDGVKLVPLTEVSELLGISKVHRIRIMSVLNLPEEGQVIAAQHNLSERTMRSVISKLKGHPDKQVEVLRLVAAWQADPASMPGATLVASTEQLVDETLAALSKRAYPKTRAPHKVKPKIKDARDLSRRVSRLLTDMETVRELETLRVELQDPDNEAVREQIYKLIEQLQEVVE